MLTLLRLRYFHLLATTGTVSRGAAKAHEAKEKNG